MLRNTLPLSSRKIQFCVLILNSRKSFRPATKSSSGDVVILPDITPLKDGLWSGHWYLVQSPALWDGTECFGRIQENKCLHFRRSPRIANVNNHARNRRLVREFLFPDDAFSSIPKWCVREAQKPGVLICTGRWLLVPWLEAKGICSAGYKAGGLSCKASLIHLEL